MNSSKVTQNSRWLPWLGFLLISLIALLTRFWDIANKPIHFDESINGWFVMQMQTQGFYKYDPNNYHGPLYFYLLQFFESLWGRSLETLRAVPATFSFFSVMIFSFAITSSRKIQAWMWGLLLVSPAFLFFGRSGIHETPFVFFQLVFALGFIRWLTKYDGRALALVLIGLWGMATLKETFVITLFCWGLGLMTLGWEEGRRILSWQKIKKAWSPALTALSCFLLYLFGALYTGFFKNGRGLLHFIEAFLPWMKTGVHGQGHEKSIGYWLQVLWEAEPLVLFGVLLAAFGIFSMRRELRLLSVFSLSQLVIYSLIPYKTVWCVLSLVWGFYFVIAYSALKVTSAKKWQQGIFYCVTAVLMVLNLRSDYQAVFRHPVNLEHPYVYVNSTLDLVKLNDFIRSAAGESTELLRSPIQIGMQEQWPWPWLLASFQDLHYDLCAKRVIESAAIYFCDVPEAAVVDTLLHEPYWKVTLTLRQFREPSVIYFKKSFFPQIPFSENVEEVGVEEIP